MAETTTLEHFRYRIRRDTYGVAQWFRGNWREKRWFRWLASLVAAGLILLAAESQFVAGLITALRDPDYIEQWQKSMGQNSSEGRES